jgi:hypothetical protein
LQLQVGGTKQRDPGRPASRSSPPVLATSKNLTMSFARPPVFTGLQPRLRVVYRSFSGRSVFLAHRLLSTSTRTHAEHTHSSASTGNRGHTHAASVGGSDVNPYKDGPSSIDKAVHLFFFTEILRGMPTFMEHSTAFIQVNPKECGLCSKISSAHRTPSCILSRRVLSHPASVGNMLSVGTPMEKSVALVSLHV